MKSTMRFRLLGMTGMATILLATAPAMAAGNRDDDRKPAAQDSQDRGAAPQSGTQTAAAPAEQDDAIVVTGLRESLKRAVDIKRSADNIIDSIVAEDIGKLPDQNIAEAIQRIPGVTISRDNGEGQFITVRGLGPAFSTALYNGRILATENQGREFSFDILPAELINRVDVSKTPTAQQVEGGIASTVDMYTARPFDFGKTKLVVSAQGNYDKLRGEVSPQASGLFSTTFGGGNFGILAAFSYIDRKIEGRRIFTDGWEANQSLDFNRDGTPEYTGVSLPTYVEYGVNATKRKRISGLLTAQARLSDSLVFTVDGLYSKLDVNDDNKVFFVYGGPGDVRSGTVDANKTLTSYTGIASGPMITSQIRPRLAQTYEVGGNLEWKPGGPLSGFLDVSWSKAKDDTGGNQAWFESNLAAPGYSPAGVQMRLVNGLPSYTGLGNFTDPSNARLGYITFEGVSVSDEIYQINSELKYDFGGGFLRRITVGGNYSDRKKERFSYKTPDALQSVFGGIPVPQSLFGDPADASDFFGIGMFPNGFPTYSATDIAAYLLTDPAINATSNPAATRAALAANGGTLDVVLIPSNSGSAQERTFGGFAQASFGGSFGSHDWSGNIGVRYTNTRVTSRGFGQEILSITTPPGLDPVVNLSAPQAISQKGNYDQWLPSANVKFDIAKDLVLQAAVAKTLTRATLSDLLLIRNINPRPRERAITDGNPGLLPMIGWNYDAALTWYIDRGSYVSAAVFQKDLKNLSESVTTTIQVLGLDFRRTRPENVGDDRIRGVEFSGQYTFTGLPAPLDGFGVQGNVSFVGKDGNTFNAVGFYEKGPLQMRLAYNHRDSYEQTAQGNRGQPVDVAAYGIWDASINFALTDNVALFAQGLNIFNEKTFTYSVYEERVITYETYGPRYAVGVRVNF
jgi:iron complex outermembrane recepter protein